MMQAFSFQILTIVFSLLLLALPGCKEQIADVNAVNANPVEVDVLDYYENGVVKMKGKSIDGKRSGKWESYYPSGYRWSEMNYRNGIREGATTTYYQNGMMRYTGYYYNDERSGLWQFYDTLGLLIQRIDMDQPLEASDSLTLKAIEAK
jgi:antitoxin component YwqK of YwqJK toxin-antitoxin module